MNITCFMLYTCSACSDLWDIWRHLRRVWYPRCHGRTLCVSALFTQKLLCQKSTNTTSWGRRSTLTKMMVYLGSVGEGWPLYGRYRFPIRLHNGVLYNNTVIAKNVPQRYVSHSWTLVVGLACRQRDDTKHLPLWHYPSLCLQCACMNASKIMSPKLNRNKETRDITVYMRECKWSKP